MLVCLSCTATILAQGEQDKWTFGSAGIDFSTGVPVPYPNNLAVSNEGCASVCDALGNILFYTNGFWIWNSDHELLPELTGGISGYKRPVTPAIGYPALMPWTGSSATQSTAIAGMPGHSGKYYVFSLSTGGQLYYTRVDKSLNRGKGGIESDYKSIFLQAGLSEKLSIVKGCNAIWVVVRSRTKNEYKAFELNDTGIVTEPVISDCGRLPVKWYHFGVIKFSPDGLRMAASCNEDYNNKGGLELYDFDPQSGKLSHPLVLDSSSTKGYYYGACFSPDNSKLYATSSSFAYADTFYAGTLLQYNLSVASATDIIASRMLMYRNYVAAHNNFGDLKRGKDGKMYFGDGLSQVHCIDNPDAAGTACIIRSGAVVFSSGITYRGMPNDVAFIAGKDSVSVRKIINVCFRDSVRLSAGIGKHYLWDNGSVLQDRIIKSKGSYTVRYINSACVQQTDSFIVQFTPLPVIGATAYSCPGAEEGKTWIIPAAADSTLWGYTWKDRDGKVLQHRLSKNGDTLSKIDTGTYFVRIVTASGCDTVLRATIKALPLPLASFSADSIFCKGDVVFFKNTSTAPLYQWHFGDGHTGDEKNPPYVYAHAGQYAAMLVVTNIEACTDTAVQQITVQELHLNLSADKMIVTAGEQLLLESSGSIPYTVTAWKPAFLMTDQSLPSQIVSVDSNRIFIVEGVSAAGCTATASVSVMLRPAVAMPNAFTPNGDGLNDRFCPARTGNILVRLFEIYNRYGQKVFAASGEAALEGWDGTFQGKILELGTYFYQIEIETKEGKSISLKGDVNMIH